MTKQDPFSSFIQPPHKSEVWELPSATEDLAGEDPVLLPKPLWLLRTGTAIPISVELIQNGPVYVYETSSMLGHKAFHCTTEAVCADDAAKLHVAEFFSYAKVSLQEWRLYRTISDSLFCLIPPTAESLVDVLE